MRFFLATACCMLFAFAGSAQLYYNLGIKGQRVNFRSVYEMEDDEYTYNSSTGVWELGAGFDTVQKKFMVYGPTLTYGFDYAINERFSVGAELEGFLGLVKIKHSGVYIDCALGAKGCYYLDPSKTYSNIFTRIGIGYGMSRSYTDNDVLGINWRFGYEYDFDYALLGVGVDVNIFKEDFAYDAQSRIDDLISQKLNSIGVVVYCSIGKGY